MPGDPPPAPRVIARPPAATPPRPAAGPLAVSESVPRHATRSLRERLGGDRGQAAVEFVALVPLVVGLIAVAYQALLAGEAVWEARVAARAAARANAFGADAAQAARAHLRPRLEHGLHVHREAGGDVRVSVRIPAVLPALRLGHVSATSHFRPQG